MFELGYRKFLSYLVVLLAQCLCRCVWGVLVLLLASFQILTFGGAVHRTMGSLLVTPGQQGLPGLPVESELRRSYVFPYVHSA